MIVIEFLRIKKSVYDVVLSKIKLLKSMDVDFNLSITVAPVFLDNEEYFLRWIEDLGIYNISYNLLHFTYETDEWKSYYKKAVKFIYKSNNLLFNKGFNDWNFIKGWLCFSFFSPIMAYFTWMTKEKGILSKIISVGIIIVTLVSDVIIFGGPRWYDFLIIIILIYLLFIKKIKR